MEVKITKSNEVGVDNKSDLSGAFFEAYGKASGLPTLPNVSQPLDSYIEIVVRAGYTVTISP
jgi:hypothetical protein